MWIPFPYTSPSSSSAGADGSGLGWTVAHPQPSTISPNTSTRHQAISFLLPVIIIGIFLAIVGSTLLIAQCLYRRIKTLHIHPSPSAAGSSSWKSYYSSNRTQGDYGEDNDDDYERGERERLLERRQSTSYFNTNRTRAPVPVVIRHDTHGRPISTWSTASSVAAQRGEELSNWTRRRDDLIKIYGRSSQHYTSSFVSGTEDLEEADNEDEGQGQEQVEDMTGVKKIKVEGGNNITLEPGNSTSPSPAPPGKHAHDHEDAHTHTQHQEGQTPSHPGSRDSSLLQTTAPGRE